MHELGIVIEIVKQMETFMKENNLTKMDKIVLQIGELSSVYPKYIEDVYPIAVEKSLLKDTKLEIEVSRGIGQCTKCHLSYPLIDNHNTCPHCGSTHFQILTGKEFLIKEVHAY